MDDPSGMLTAGGRRRDLFEEAAAIIESEYREPLTSPVVARRLGASTRSLQRAFAETAGSSFSDYLREVRLRRGAELLQGSDLPVKTVAYLVGYRDHSAFSRQFRSRFGHPPRMHRIEQAAWTIGAHTAEVPGSDRPGRAPADNTTGEELHGADRHRYQRAGPSQGGRGEGQGT